MYTPAFTALTRTIYPPTYRKAPRYFADTDSRGANEYELIPPIDVEAVRPIDGARANGGGGDCEGAVRGLERVCGDLRRGLRPGDTEPERERGDDGDRGGAFRSRARRSPS